MGAHSLTRAVRATCAVRAVVETCSPAVVMSIRTLIADPVCTMAAADCTVMGRFGVFDCVPLLDKVWGLGGKGVVGAHSSTRAVRAACAFCSVLDSCCPAVLMPIRTLVAGPVNLATSPRSDQNVAEGSIMFMIPLALQQRAEEADVWATGRP